MSLADSKWAPSLLASAALVCSYSQSSAAQDLSSPRVSDTPLPPEGEATWFGDSIESVGDFDKDGHDDLAVAAPEAWSVNGRTGQVLILSGKDGKILRELHGEAGEERFGCCVSAVRPSSKEPPTCLAVTWAKLGDHRFAYQVKIISLLDDQLLATIPDAIQILGSPGDLDGDRKADYAIHFAGPTDRPFGALTRWYSGTTWKPIDRPEIPEKIRLLDEDYDGDGIRDHLFRERSEGSFIQVRSSATDGVITSLKLKPGRDPGGWESAVCIVLEVDGKRAIVLSNPDRERGMAAISAFSGVTGELELETTFGKWLPIQSDRYTFELHAGFDGHSFYAVRTPGLDEELQAYSGRTLELLWRAPHVVEEGSHPLTFLRERRTFPSTGYDVELAVGKLWVGYGGRVELYGEVGILSPATGVPLRWLREPDYPTLTRAHYAAQQGGEKK